MTMQATPTNPATERIEANLLEHHSAEVRALDQAAARRTQQRAAMLRPDGQPKYVEAEYRERLAVIDGEFEVAAARITATSETVIEATRRELTLLDGADPFARLTAEQQRQAADRREFIREDVEQQPPDDLARTLRAALAADDRVVLYLFGRYLTRRLEALPVATRLELHQLSVELADRLAEPGARGKRERLERKLSAAQVLRGQVNTVRRGGAAGLAARMKASGRYGQ